jgi:hypothetical protein
LEKGGKVAKFLIITSAFCSTCYLFYGSSGWEKGGKVVKLLIITSAFLLSILWFFWFGERRKSSKIINCDIGLLVIYIMVLLVRKKGEK